MSDQKKNETWKTELRNAFRNTRELASFLDWELPETPFPLILPRRLAERIREFGPDSALAKQFLPDARENQNAGGQLDPIGDEAHAKAPQIIHRYPSRALFLPTTTCPVICRYCFRKNELHSQTEFLRAQNSETLAYLKNHPEIKELIWSGGDPLMLNNEKILSWSRQFHEIGIQALRFHSRFPVILPSRITNEFVQTLKTLSELFSPLSLVIHVNHTEEIDGEVKKSLEKLRGLPLHLFSQTVLLKGVNDNTDTLEKLFWELAKLGVIPYYLHHPDQVRGAEYYQLQVEKGRQITRDLRNRLPGWAIPTYILDLPGGRGKTPLLNPESEQFSGNLLDRNGKIQRYSDPSPY